MSSLTPTKVTSSATQNSLSIKPAFLRNQAMHELNEKQKVRMLTTENKRAKHQLYLLRRLVFLGVVHVAVVSTVTVIHRCTWRYLLRLGLRHAKYRCCDGG